MISGMSAVAPLFWCGPWPSCLDDQVLPPRLLFLTALPGLSRAASRLDSACAHWPRIHTSKLFRHLPIYVVT